MSSLDDHLRAVIIGTAMGDAIGLPREGLSRRRAQQIFGGRPLGHRLVLSHGMVSDDTEHTCMAAQALLASGGNPDGFARSMAWRLRWWFIGVPAGVGMATAKSCLKLWLGFPPSRSGVWSAGNGPAMRAAILGVYASDEIDLLQKLVTASTRLTHSDLAAEHGALAVALAAAYAVGQQERTPGEYGKNYLEFIRPYLVETEMFRLIEQVVQQIAIGSSLANYLALRHLEKGISGYVNHTVPAAIFCWLSHPTDFRTAVEQVVIAGGDADSAGAITGALTSLSAGRESIPDEWVAGLLDWPNSISRMERLADALAQDRHASVASRRPLPLFWPAVLVRNAIFIAVVVVHALRRLLPPY